MPHVHAQQSDTDRQALAQLRAKAETGDAASQFEMGTADSITGAVQIVTRNETVLARPTIMADEARAVFGSGAELRVSEEELCTLPPESFQRSVAVSPDFTRVAFACEDDSGAWVVVNGVSSKKYPGLLAVPPLFSRDGNRVAFVAASKVENRSWVVVDGKEWPKVERVAKTNCLTFSPDGKHLAFLGGNDEKAFVMLEGVAGPPYEEIGALKFSREGNRLAYVATPREGKQLVVVDGQPGKEYDGVRAPVFSPDGKHFAFVASRDQEQFVVLDGKEQKAYPQIPAIGSTALETPFFSRDGKRMAYFAGSPGKWRVVEGLSESQEWDSLGKPIFSPDSQHLAYHAGRGGNPFLVFDGVSQPLVGETVSVAMEFSPDSKRFAHVLVRAPGKMCVIVDGKPGADYEHIATDEKGMALSFSPDSQHLAYVAEQVFGWHVVRDGVAGKGYVLVASVKFSPDSAHLAYQADRGARRGLVVDGMEADFKLGAYIIADHRWKDAKTVQTALARGKTLLRVEVTIQE